VDTVRRLVRKIREVGLRYTARLVMRGLIPAPLFRLTRMVILEIRPDRTAAPPVVEECIRWAHLEDVPDLTALGHAPEVLRRRLDSGARACVFTDVDGILGYVWFHGPSHDEEDLAVRFALGAGEIWLFDAMVKAEHRGRGIYPRLLRQATLDLGEDGIQRILIAIESANRNSRRAHEAAAAKVIGTVCSLRILGFTFVRYGRGPDVAWRGRMGYVGLRTSTLA
jgi:ribosomal protein S18 acetylase RimI-like enzyme